MAMRLNGWQRIGIVAATNLTNDGLHLQETLYERRPRLLEQRIRWLEWKVVRLVWFSITAVSFMAGFFAYKTTVEELGHWIVLGCAAAVWLLVALYLKRVELKGAPTSIQFIDP
jgi:hypothetical protein